MKIIEFFLRQSKLNYTLSLFFLLMGIYTYQTLPRELFPPVDSDKIIIQGAYAGASAENLDKIAVSEIEEEVRGLSAVYKVESTIRSGSFTIIATLKENGEKNRTLELIKDTIALTKPNLPSDMDEPTATVLENKIPLMQVSIASETLPLETLLKQAKEVKKELSAIPHLSDVRLYGDSEREIQIRLDSAKVRAYKLDPRELSSAIARLSYIFPLGKIESREGHFYLSTVYGKRDADSLRDTILKFGKERVRLGDVASIEYGYGESSTLSSFNGQRAFSVNIAKDEKGDAIALSKLLHQRLSELEKRYPDLSIRPFSDTSVYIKSRLNTVIANITLGFILVSLSMYWLINKRISFVVALGIPFSFLIGAIFFYLSGNTLNIISLLGVLIALGILVDDAIIVSENIQRHIEEGASPYEAALQGTKEVIKPVLVAAATTVFAFLPMLLMGGEVGKLIKMIPLAITILLLASLLESFLFLPLHSAHLLSGREKTRDWSRFNALYQRSLGFFFKRRTLSLALFVILVPTLTILGFSHSKYQLFPRFDGSEVYITGRLDANHTLEETQALVKSLERELLAKKEEFFIQSTSAVSGFMMDATGESEIAPHLFMIFAELEEPIEDNFIERYIAPWLSFDWDNSHKKRTKKSFEIEELLQAYVEEFKLKHRVEELRVSAPRAGLVKHDVEISLLGADEKLPAAIEELMNALAGIKGIKNFHHDMKKGISEIKLALNPYGESLGLSEGYLSAILSDYFLSAKRGKSLDSEGVVHIRLEDSHKDSLTTLRHFPIPLPSGVERVALQEVVDFHIQIVPEKIIKKGGERQRSVYADVLPDELTSLELLAKLQPTLQKIRQSGITLKLGGEKEKNERFIQDMILASILALFLIFLTLLLMFDSLLLSLTILSVIPLSFLGVLVGHFLLGLNLTMPSIVGILGLAGVVINDGIVMVDFLRQAKNDEEFFRRATQRLRPILLTSITTFIGLATLIFFPSGQAKTLQPLATSLGFGLAWGTILNLYYLPLLFAFLQRFERPKMGNLLARLTSRLNKKSL